MRKVMWISLLLVLTLCVVPVFAQKGNNLPDGVQKLYSLQIIAYDESNCPQHVAQDNSRRQIAVKADVGANHPDRQLYNELIRDNDILLSKGEFRVLDGNACIDGTASFQLPDPAVDGSTSISDPTFAYQVWIRLVGKPYTGIDVATCAVDPLDPTTTADDLVRCSVEEIEMTREKGKGSAPKFQNVSKELLSVCADTSDIPDGICDIRLPLFAAPYYGYWWDWGTIGKAHAQLVFAAPKD